MYGHKAKKKVTNLEYNLLNSIHPKTQAYTALIQAYTALSVSAVSVQYRCSLSI